MQIQFDGCHHVGHHEHEISIASSVTNHLKLILCCTYHQYFASWIQKHRGMDTRHSEPRVSPRISLLNNTYIL
jgi:hypothetical protein